MLEGSETVVLWRAYVPKWAYLPLSGEGAAKFGGRWNPVGIPAVYAALERSTAWAEYNQEFVQHPALIAQLELIGAHLANLIDIAALAQFGVDVSIHRCEWRADLDRGVVPATHTLYEGLVATGLDGVVYSSFMSQGGRCVALWYWNGLAQPSLHVSIRKGGCRQRHGRGFLINSKFRNRAGEGASGSIRFQNAFLDFAANRDMLSKHTGRNSDATGRY